MLTTIREEQFLAKFAGEDVPVPQPCTRTEKFLAKMAGVDVQTPAPITREEQILNKIAEGGGGGGDSDLSTATVTVYNPDLFDLSIILPVINPRIEGVTCAPIYGTGGGESGDTVEVVLYKNKCLAGWSAPGYKLETTGDIENYPGEGVLITGDGTITFVQDTI